MYCRRPNVLLLTMSLILALNMDPLETAYLARLDIILIGISPAHLLTLFARLLIQPMVTVTHAMMGTN